MTITKKTAGFYEGTHKGIPFRVISFNRVGQGNRLVVSDWGFVLHGKTFRGYATKKEAFTMVEKTIG